MFFPIAQHGTYQLMLQHPLMHAWRCFGEARRSQQDERCGWQAGQENADDAQRQCDTADATEEEPDQT